MIREGRDLEAIILEKALVRVKFEGIDKDERL
jgi:hypothetical protein